MNLNESFRKFAAKVSFAVGTARAFVLAIVIIVVWLITGPLFHFSDTWQLVINTATTIVTFIMVFLIQNTQNRDSKAINLKLDELLRGVKGARTGMVNLEELPDETLAEFQTEFRKLQERFGKRPLNKKYGKSSAIKKVIKETRLVVERPIEAAIKPIEKITEEIEEKVERSI